MDNKTKIIGNIVGVPNPKSDWAQNDETKANFVKNRTHYTETVLLCDYTHTLDMENWDSSDYGGTFVLDKEVNPDSLKLYINGEYVPTTYVYYDVNMVYRFHINAEEDYTFEYDTRNKSISFPPWVTKGNNYKVYEETVYQLDEKYIPDTIARVKYVDDKIGDIDTALDGIIALQESLIGGAE